MSTVTEATIPSVGPVGPVTPSKEDDNCAATEQQIAAAEDNVSIEVNKSVAELEDQTNIALRTRSKLSLSSIPLEVIEEQLIPPDITTDMYDLDWDNPDWMDFLKNLTKPLDEVTKGDDEDHDPEYNILADEGINEGNHTFISLVIVPNVHSHNEEVDHEELRVDRGVRVTRKELNSLIAELSDCCDSYATQNQRTTEDVECGETVVAETLPEPTQEVQVMRLLHYTTCSAQLARSELA